MTRAEPGKKIRTLPAGEWNDMAAAAAAFRSGRLGMDGDGGGFDYPNPPTIKVRNDTGAALPRFSVVGIGDPWTTPSTGGATLDVFKTRKTAAAAIPAEAHRGKFAILVDGCMDHGVVDAIASGIVQCQVQVDAGEEDFEFADVEPGSTDVLHVVRSGSARVLWRESGTGTKWAQVRISNKPAEIARCYFKGVRLYRPTDGYRSSRDILYSRSPGSVYWTDSIGDVAGCNLSVNTGSVAAYTDYALKVLAAGYYEFDWRVSVYDNTQDTDKGKYQATTDAGGLPSHTHTVDVPEGRDGISSFSSIKYRASGGGEGDWLLLATAAAQNRDFPCLNQSYLGNYASCSPRGLIYLAANAEIVFRVICNAPAASAGQYDDANIQVVGDESYTNLSVAYHGPLLATAVHYP